MAAGLLLLALPRRAAAAGGLWQRRQQQQQYGMRRWLGAADAAGFVRAPLAAPGAGVRSLAALRRLAAKGKGKEAEDPNDPSNMYRDTVTLPQTGFDQRANAPVREPQIQAFWEQERVYQSLYEKAQGAYVRRRVGWGGVVGWIWIVCIGSIGSLRQPSVGSQSNPTEGSHTHTHTNTNIHHTSLHPTQARSSCSTTGRPTQTGTCTSGTLLTRF